VVSCAVGAGPSQEVLAEVEALLADLHTTAPNSVSSTSSSSSSSPAALLLRGPALAQVEFVWRKVQLGLSSQEDLAAAVAAYHNK
jgi:hypothetical protein